MGIDIRYVKKHISECELALPGGYLGFNLDLFYLLMHIYIIKYFSKPGHQRGF